MGYGLGIDIGTTFTAAAVCRDGRVATVELGDRSAAVPSVLYLGADGSVQVGELANRAALREPGRVTREFKRRVGDSAPLIIGSSPYSADGLVAKLLSWVVDAVSAREGGRPDRVSLTYPANWGQYKRDLMRQAADRAGVGQVSLLAEPAAAAASYAAADRVDVGTTVAVYDLGGGTFDAAVLRKTPGGFELLGAPQGIERLGGIDFDEAVFAHVGAALGGALKKLDPENPADVASVAQLRAECVAAKEALSEDTEAAVAVMLPGSHTTVRLARAEFEEMVRPAITETVRALSRAVGSAGLQPAGVDTVLLVGGSSRIPLVSELVSAEFGRPIATDVHPTNAVAIGAAHTLDTRPAMAPAATRPAQPPAPRPAAAASHGRAPVPVGTAGAAGLAGAGSRSAGSRSAGSGAGSAGPGSAGAGPGPPGAGRPAGRGSTAPARTPTAARGFVAAAPPSPPARPPGPIVATREPAPPPARLTAQPKRRGALIAVAVVAVLIAGGAVWLASQGGSAAPGTETTPAAATGTTHKAANPAKAEPSASAAPSKNTVQSLKSKPCTALTEAQLTGVDVRGPSKEGPPGLCSWPGNDSPGVTVAAATGFDAYANAAANKSGYATFKTTRIAGYEAAQYTLGASDGSGLGSCSVTVRIGPTESITTGSSGATGDQDGCGKATSVAEAVLANF